MKQVRSLDRGLDLMEVLAREGAQTLAQLHAATGLPKSTIRRLLATLQAHFAGALDRPASIDALTLFVEPEPGGAFRQHRRFPLPAGSDAGAVRNMSHA